MTNQISRVSKHWLFIYIYIYDTKKLNYIDELFLPHIDGDKKKKIFFFFFNYLMNNNILKY